ncbi:hypothetical protein PF010_g24387 [Phytophthora fragariae]|uniref:Uncharacterized protein n=1 Tax=Phytophthora fragariae TaxID=53985 RepID=A0A6G0K2N7_9STRA|nr:hypothetical protein PF010_g24387 [Phytophthora fragariae]
MLPVATSEESSGSENVSMMMNVGGSVAEVPVVNAYIAADTSDRQNPTVAKLSRSYAQYPVQEMANDQEKKQLLPWPPYAGQSSSDARMQQASHPMQAVPR